MLNFLKYNLPTGDSQCYSNAVHVLVLTEMIYTWRTVWRFLKKLEIELPYDTAFPLLGIHTEETRNDLKFKCIKEGQ